MNERFAPPPSTPVPTATPVSWHPKPVVMLFPIFVLNTDDVSAASVLDFPSCLNLVKRERKRPYPEERWGGVVAINGNNE